MVTKLICATKPQKASGIGGTGYLPVWAWWEGYFREDPLPPFVMLGKNPSSTLHSLLPVEAKLGISQRVGQGNRHVAMPGVIFFLVTTRHQFAAGI